MTPLGADVLRGVRRQRLVTTGDRLIVALSGGPDSVALTLLMREVVGLSYVEIAEELNLPVGTVRSRLHAAREQFRRMWLEEDVDPR